MSLTRRVRKFAGWTRKTALDWLYHGTISRWTWWPIEPVARRKNGRVAAPPNPRVAYYVWHFPTLSETFVRREVQALRRRGVAMTVLAEAAEDVELLDDAGRALLESTHYLRPIDKRLLARYKKMFRRAKPVGYANLYLYLMLRKYGLTKSRGPRGPGTGAV